MLAILALRCDLDFDEKLRAHTAKAKGHTAAAAGATRSQQLHIIDHHALQVAPASY